jgi:hypothetical protein
MSSGLGNRTCGAPSLDTLLLSAHHRPTSAAHPRRLGYSIQPLRHRPCTIQAAAQQSADDPTDGPTASPSSRGSKMSNHLLLKPASTSSLYRETDFRITGPNLALDEVINPTKALSRRRHRPLPLISTPFVASLSPLFFNT